jgi:hypothetical protein
VSFKAIGPLGHGQLPVGTRVQVVSDDAPPDVGIAIEYDEAGRPRPTDRALDRRPVIVTLLDGERSGSGGTVARYNLRPDPEPGPRGVPAADAATGPLASVAEASPNSGVVASLAGRSRGPEEPASKPQEERPKAGLLPGEPLSELRAIARQLASDAPAERTAAVDSFRLWMSQDGAGEMWVVASREFHEATSALARLMKGDPDASLRASSLRALFTAAKAAMVAQQRAHASFLESFPRIHGRSPNSSDLSDRKFFLREDHEKVGRVIETIVSGLDPKQA